MPARPLPQPFRAVLDLLFPPRCQGCGRFGPEWLCGDCLAAVRLISPPFCLRCGVPFDPLAKGGPLCARCRPRPRFPYTWSRSAVIYEGPLREAVQALKFSRRRVLADPLADMMAAAVGRWQKAGLPGSDPTQWSALVPVPLHPDRLRARGFNQSELLCRRLGERLGVRVEPLLVRRLAAPPQVELPAEQRVKNVRGAFAPAPGAPIVGRCLVVVDDLWTTGSTLTECARALRGAAAVYLLSLARPRLRRAG